MIAANIIIKQEPTAVDHGEVLPLLLSLHTEDILLQSTVVCFLIRVIMILVVTVVSVVLGAAATAAF